MSVQEWHDRTVAWSNAHPPPLAAPMGSRTPRSETEHREWLRWSRSLHEAGLAVMRWPAEWGGEEVGIGEALAVSGVLSLAGAPLPLTDIGINLVGPAITRFGDEDQKRRYLIPIAEGTAIWVQLFSEPGSGSDLASLRTRARQQDDGTWVVDGQKVWSTYGHLADFGFLLARTGAADSRHRGISAFVVPMDAPGLTIRPIREITGDHDFNEVFFDAVHLPADALVGEIDGGWKLAMSLLADEHWVVGRLVGWLSGETERLAALIGSLASERAPGLIARLGELVAEVTALEATVGADDAPAGADSLTKIVFSEINIELHQFALDLVSEFPALVPPMLAERWNDSYMYTRSYTISGGANEVLRNVIAKRVLELT